jgi:tripartite-type tricarboxylate transporter receptor subunit TctC
VPGVGSGGHVEGIIFQNVTGTDFQFVPHRGAGPAVQDLVAGQIDMMFAGATNTLPQVRAGQIKAMAVMAKSRLSVALDIPTADEAGLSGLYSSNWLGVGSSRIGACAVHEWPTLLPLTWRHSRCELETFRWAGLSVAWCT